MVSTSDFEKGMVIKMDNDPWQIVDFQFVHPGKGSAFIRTTLKNLKTNKVLDKSFKSGDHFEEIEFEYKKAVYLYKDRKNAVFNLKENKQRISFPLENVKNKIAYLRENFDVDLIYIGNELSGLNILKKVALKVIEAPPAIKGDTVTGSTKTVTLETGLKVNAPIFIKEGETILVNTETGEYAGRA